jgi:hypothetical protein
MFPIIYHIYKAIKKKQSDIFIYSKNNEFFFIAYYEHQIDHPTEGGIN